MNHTFGNENMKRDPREELTASEQSLLEQLYAAYDDTEDCEVTDEEVEYVLNKVRCYLNKERDAEAQEYRLRRLNQAHREAMRGSRSATLDALTLDLGTLADSLGATRGWIYLMGQEEREVVLRAVVTHRTNQRDVKLTIGLETSGVIAAAARAMEPGVFVSKACATHDENGFHDRSTIAAIPIFDAEDEWLLGVLCLETTSREFTPADQSTLQVAVRRLAVPMICLQWNRPEARHWPWAPAHQRWGTAIVPHQVCGTLVKALGYGDYSDDYCAMLWLMDRSKNVLQLLGTTYYDTEFLCQEQLPRDSFTGAISDLTRGSVEKSTPRDPRFLMQKRAMACGLQEIVSAPVYRPDEFGDVPKKSWGVLNTYYFRECTLSESRYREDFAEVVLLVEEWLAHYERIRLQCALSYLRWKHEVARTVEMKRSHLDEQANSGWLRATQYDVLRDVLTDVLGADGCSLYVPDEQRERLVMVTSTGVGMKTRYDAECIVQHPDNGFSVWYSLGNPADEQYGIMSYLSEHPEVGVLRINSLDRFERGEEPGIPESVPRRVLRTQMEPVGSEDADRRVLALSTKEGTHPSMAVRLVRSTAKPPFTEDEATLLQQMVQLSSSQDFFSLPDRPQPLTLSG